MTTTERMNPTMTTTNDYMLANPDTDATPENLSTIRSLVSKRQWENVRVGLDMKTARRLAADDIGSMLKPPMDGKELERWMGREQQKLKRESIARVMEAIPAPVVTVTPVDAKELKAVKERANGKVFSAIYREWLVNNDTVTDDKQVAHFAGVNDNSPSYVRGVLKSEGWTFEPLPKHTGWKVTHRPAGANVIDLSGFTPEQLTAITKLLKSLKGAAR